MMPYTYVICLVLLLGQCNPSVQIIWGPLISNATGVYDVVTLAISAVDFISGNQSAEDKLLNNIKESINNSKAEVLEGILLQSRFDKIDDALRSIHSSLIDFETYLEASTSEKDARKQEYISRFDDNSVISHIQFLSELLNYSIPGTTGQTIISSFSENAACNKIKIRNFQTFYFHVISDGIALEIIHTKFKNLDPSNSLNRWAGKMVTIRNVFQNADDECWCSSYKPPCEEIYEKYCGSEFLEKVIFGGIALTLLMAVSIGCCCLSCRVNRENNRGGNSSLHDSSSSVGLNFVLENIRDEHILLGDSSSNVGLNFVLENSLGEKSSVDDSSSNVGLNFVLENIIGENSSLDDSSSNVGLNFALENIRGENSSLDDSSSNVGGEKKSLDDSSSNVGGENSSLDDSSSNVGSEKSSLDDSSSNVGGEKSSLDDSSSNVGGENTSLDD